MLQRSLIKTSPNLFRPSNTLRISPLLRCRNHWYQPSSSFHSRASFVQVKENNMNSNRYLSTSTSSVSAKDIESWASLALTAQGSDKLCDNIVNFLQEGPKVVKPFAETISKYFFKMIETQRKNPVSFQKICQTMSQSIDSCIWIGEHLQTGNNMRNIIYDILENSSQNFTVPCISGMVNVLSSFLDNNPAENVEWFLQKDGLTLLKNLSVQFPLENMLIVSIFDLLYSASNTLENARKTSRMLELVQLHLADEKLYAETSKDTIEAALAFLSQLSTFSKIAMTLNEDLLNTVIRTVRARTKEEGVVHNGFIFLAQMRHAHKAKGFSVGRVSEKDFVLTIIDTMKAHEHNPVIVANGFTFILGLSAEEPQLFRVGQYHAKVALGLMKKHTLVADVQVYGCLALELIAQHNSFPIATSGVLEHVDKIHQTFPRDPYVRNCASYLAHTLHPKTKNIPHHFVSVPAEWDYTAGGPGTMSKYEGGGSIMYVGGTDKPMTKTERADMANQATVRGFNSVEDIGMPFSEDESPPIPDLYAPSTDDDVPDFSLLVDKSKHEKIKAMMEEELKYINRHFQKPKTLEELLEETPSNQTISTMPEASLGSLTSSTPPPLVTKSEKRYYKLLEESLKHENVPNLPVEVGLPFAPEKMEEEKKKYKILLKMFFVLKLMNFKI